MFLKLKCQNFVLVLIFFLSFSCIYKQPKPISLSAKAASSGPTESTSSTLLLTSNQLSSYDFGSVHPDSTSGELTVFYTITGNEKGINCSGPTLSGTNPTNFKIIKSSCAIGQWYGEMNSCYAKIVASPSSETTFTAIVSRSCSNSNTDSFSISVTGTSLISVDTVLINEGDLVTDSTSNTVSFNVSGTNVKNYCLTENSSNSSCNWRSYTNQTEDSFIFSSTTNEIKTIYVFARDASSNISTSANDTIIFDNVSPTSPSFVSNTTDVSSSSLDLTWINGSDTFFSYTLVKACTSSNCETGCLASTLNSTSTTGSITGAVHGGVYYPCLKTFDSGGKSSSYVHYTTPITVDLVAPTADSILINGGSSLTADENVSVAFTYSGDATKSCILEGTSVSTSSCSWSTDITSPNAFTLSQVPEGSKTLNIYFMDAVGNISNARTATITLKSDTNLAGGNTADTITGGHGADQLEGGAGGDTISGGYGDDIIWADEKNLDIKSLTGLKLWVDIPQNFYFSRDAYRIFDFSGHGYFYDQTDDTLRPSTIAGYINGRRVLTFTGAEKYLGQSILDVSDTTYSIAAAVNVTTGGANGVFWEQNASAANNYQRAALMYQSAGSSYFSGQNHDYLIEALAVNQEYFVLMSYDSGFINAVSSTGTSSGNTSNIAQTGKLSNYVSSIGYKSPTNTEFFKGYLGEIFVFENSRETENATADLAHYMSYKWGLPFADVSLDYDTLTGGNGADIFVWSNRSFSGTTDAVNRDVITDFTPADGDKIYLQGWSEFLTVRGSSSFDPSSDESELRWTSGQNPTIVQVDFGGDATADFEIELTGDITLSLSDFQFGKVIGSEAPETLSGGFGDDIIVGGLGGDTLYGNAGNDKLYPDNLPFAEKTVGNQAVWFKADDISGDQSIWTNDITIDAVYNFSHESFDIATQYRAGGIYYVENGFNNMPVMSFDSSGTFRGWLNNPIGATKSIFTISKNTGTVDGNGGILTFLRGGVGYFGIGGNYYIDGHGCGFFSTVTKYYDITMMSAILPSVNNYIYSSMYIDGSFDGMTTASCLNSNVDYYEIGGRTIESNIPHRVFVGDIAEGLAYGHPLNNGERIRVESYIAGKYGQPYNNYDASPDTLYGGDGADQFIWTNGSYSGVGANNRDVIKDFTRTDSDKIVFEGFDYSFIFRAGGNGEADFVAGTRSIAYKYSGVTCSDSDLDGRCTVIYVDIDGDGTTEMEIEINYEIDLIASDFVDGQLLTILENNTEFYVDAATEFSLGNATEDSCPVSWTDLSHSGFDLYPSGFGTCDNTNGWTGNGSTSTPYALQFSSVTSSYMINSSPDVTLGNYTIEIWEKLPATGQASNKSFYANFDGALAVDNIQISTAAGAPGTINSITAANAVIVNQDTNWNHIVVTWDGTTLKTYANGQAGATDTNPGNYFRDHIVGRNRGGAITYLDGKVALVRILNTDLSIEEVFQLCIQNESRFTSTPGSICVEP